MVRLPAPEDTGIQHKSQQQTLRGEDIMFKRYAESPENATPQGRKQTAVGDWKIAALGVDFRGPRPAAASCVKQIAVAQSEICRAQVRNFHETT